MLNQKQLETLARPINRTRIEKRRQGGKDLSYLAAWDVKAHLIRCFGYGNWDSHLVEYHHVATREYESADKKPMIEVVYSGRLTLVVRDEDGEQVCSYTEGACGSASGPASMLGDHHDNALKTMESDALKRAAVNLGNQFGISLYSDGSTADVVRGTVLDVEKTPADKTPEEKEAEARVAASLGATPVDTPNPNGADAQVANPNNREVTG